MAEVLEWKTYDHSEQTHTPDWYWTVGIIALAIVVTATILNNILFAVLIFISTLVLFLRTLQKPKLTRYELSSKGIKIGKQAVPYGILESFWVEEEYNPAKIIIKQKAFTSALLIVPIGETDPQTVRDYLANYLPEVENHEPLSKKFMEFLGF